MTNIAGVNLNLLLVLDALLSERHVSRAARRLGLSQPAVSHALAQLRALVDDPLFLRSGANMVPTERALALAGPIQGALSTIQEALAPPSAFEPARLDRTFVIAATDFVEYLLLPRLLARLGREAPGVKLLVRAWPHDRVPPTLASGELDLSIGPFDTVPPGHHGNEPLFSDDFVCIVRKDHPRVRRRLTLEAYTSLSHVLVSSESSAPGVVDVALARHGLKRTVGLRTSHFLMVPAVVAATDMVAAISSRVAARAAPEFPLRILPPPLELPTGLFLQVWHERTRSSAAHAWLRRVVAEVAAKV